MTVSGNSFFFHYLFFISVKCNKFLLYFFSCIINFMFYNYLSFNVGLCRPRMVFKSCSRLNVLKFEYLNVQGCQVFVLFASDYLLQ